MRDQRRMLAAVVGIMVWTTVGLGVARAEVIAPVDPSTGQLLTGGNLRFTASIFDPATGRDITNAWLPEWRPPPANQPIANGGTPVYVVFHDAQGALVVPTSLAPVLPGSSQASLAAFTGATNPFFSPLSTSAYPGQCTNFGSPTDLTEDFDFTQFNATTQFPFTSSTGAAKIGFRLIPADCGGMAVITATATIGNVPTTHTFILPQSSTLLNGIADIWATAFCPGNSCPSGREDADASAGNPTNGDGIFSFDEYRGFIVSGNQVRTDPAQKDLFLHLVNPQCVAGDPLSSTASLLGGPNSIVSGNALFSNTNTLISGNRIHRLGYATPNAPHLTTDEWVDRFDHYSVADGLRFVGNVTTAPADDRQINKNAVFFNLVPVDPPATNLSNGERVQHRGLRFIECLDTSTPSILGFATPVSPNGPNYAILFTQNIVNYITGTLGASCTPSDPCSYSTFQNGAWTTPVEISQNDLKARAIEFFFAHEIGHTVLLTPTVEGTNKTSYGYHHAPGTGSNLDQTIENKVSNRTGNTFWIPLLYNTSDLTSYRLR